VNSVLSASGEIQRGIAAGPADRRLLRKARETKRIHALYFARMDGAPKSDTDLLLPELLEPKIAGTVFAAGLHYFASLGSTNVAAMRAAAESREHGEAQPARGEVWIAEEQTAGKGRAGHQWHSHPGEGIYLSALLRPRLAPADAIVLSLAAGLALVEAVHEITGVWGDLRWPNDVLLNEKKFCGILAELSAETGEPARVRYVVIGVGVNVNNAEFPPELAPIATSLERELGHKISRVELTAALLRALDREVAQLDPTCGKRPQTSGAHALAAAREDILRRFEQHSSYCRGAAVTVDEDGGYEGITRGLDAQGFLRVETAQGMRTVLSGGVRKR
jgi:BirA family transcriptional regulator, biotin operon repressor / biotin---[acetyl-CoA-carboxylase] ligase